MSCHSTITVIPTHPPTYRSVYVDVVGWYGSCHLVIESITPSFHNGELPPFSWYNCDVVILPRQHRLPYVTSGAITFVSKQNDDVRMVPSERREIAPHYEKTKSAAY